MKQGIPFEHFELLEREGYLKLTIPKEYGGDGPYRYMKFYWFRSNWLKVQVQRL